MGKKFLVFTDIHFGEHGNSDDFNQSCLDFIEFMADYYRSNVPEEGRGGAIFMGDWYHSRNQVNVKTMDYAVSGLRLLNERLPKTYMILGNHDLFYLDRRDITSVHLPNGSTNIQVIAEPTRLTLDGKDCILCPWLVGEETVSGVLTGYITAPDYVFGHFELPSFYLNRSVVFKPDEDFDIGVFKGVKRIFSGHFHKRQERANICYIGNCFSHNFSDTNDYHNKGFGIVDMQENAVEFVEWNDAPKYICTKLSDIATIQNDLNKTVHLRLINDAGLMPNELNTISEKLEAGFGVTDTSFIQPDLVTENRTDETLEHVSDINKLVIDSISGMTFNGLSTTRLVELYQSL